MDGFDCQRYEELKKKVANAGLKMNLKGSKIFISSFGNFDDVYAAFMFMCGYEAGSEKGE